MKLFLIVSTLIYHIYISACMYITISVSTYNSVDVLDMEQRKILHFLKQLYNTTYNLKFKYLEMYTDFKR